MIFQREIIKVNDQVLVKGNGNSINAVHVVWIVVRITGTSQSIVFYRTTIWKYEEENRKSETIISIYFPTSNKCSPPHSLRHLNTSATAKPKAGFIHEHGKESNAVTFHSLPSPLLIRGKPDSGLIAAGPMLVTLLTPFIRPCQEKRALKWQSVAINRHHTHVVHSIRIKLCYLSRRNIWRKNFPDRDAAVAALWNHNKKAYATV